MNFRIIYDYNGFDGEGYYGQAEKENNNWCLITPRYFTKWGCRREINKCIRKLKDPEIIEEFEVKI